MLQALVEDLRLMAPDHVIVTGDLTHLGLPDELAQVSRWLPCLGAPDQVTVVPGNHDCYSPSDWRNGAPLWEPYMRSDERSRSSPATVPFPVVRERGGVALLGVSSATSSPPFFATGSVGSAQSSVIAQRLAAARARRQFRVVALHHPPLAETVSWRRRLTDGSRLRKALTSSGVELVLHGHAHRTERSRLATADGEALVVGARSGSSRSDNPARTAQYHVYEIVPAADGWRLTCVIRGLAARAGRFEPAGDWGASLRRTFASVAA